MTISLRARLTAVYTCVLLVAAALFEIGAYSTVSAAIHSVSDRELSARLAGIEDHLVRHLDKFGWPQMRTALNAHPSFEPSCLVVRSTHETFFEGSSMAGLPLPGNAGLHTVLAAGKTFRVLSASRIIDGTPYNLMVATDLGMASAILSRLWLMLLISIPPVLLLSAAAGFWMSGRALAPVREMIAAARSIDVRRLNQRVPVPRTGDELQHLAETVNGLLGRIETGVNRIRQFTADASHELRTPVAIVRAAAEVALLRPKPTEQFYRDTLERILRESERNSLLLEDMLELSRLDSSALPEDCRLLDLSLALRDVCERLSPMAQSKQLMLRYALPESAVRVWGAEEQLRRLWQVLIENAMKYTPEGGSIAVSLRTTAEASIVEVQDTGIGIAHEHHSRIFDRFYRSDKARTRADGGYGLGLSIAREIALQHGATITVVSELGRGACFSVTFPSQPAFSLAAPRTHTALLR